MINFSVVFAANIEINNADDKWIADISSLPAGLTDSSNSAIKIPIDIQVANADQTWSANIDVVPQSAVDSSGSLTKIPVGIQICNADMVMTKSLESADIDSGPTMLSKTPVVFVPGFLGTNIRSSTAELVWFNIGRTFFSPFDEFLDDLSFLENLAATKPGLSIGSVIRKEIIPLHWDFDYTEGLITEFAGQGYTEGKDFILFPYDWRYGVSGTYPMPEGSSQRSLTNSDLLGVKIKQLAQISPTGKVDVIAHSMGGLIAKKYALAESDPKIRKLVLVGVPNLGTPQPAKALLLGDDFQITGLNSSEIKKIGQNMPAAYDLLPSAAYNTAKGSWLTSIVSSGSGQNSLKQLGYDESQLVLAGAGLNQTAMVNSRRLHSAEFDAFSDWNSKQIDAYNLVGCQMPTIGNIEDWDNSDGTHGYFDARALAVGDDTVVFESANSLGCDDDKTFYFPRVPHGQMPSADNVRPKIVNIISNSNLPIANGQAIAKQDLTANPSKCELFGTSIVIQSPVDIFVTLNGKRLGLDENGNIVREIEGADFDIVNGHKYIFLPDEVNGHYEITLTGTGNGTFTLLDKEIRNSQVVSTTTYSNVPVVLGSQGSLEISAAQPMLRFDSTNDGTQEIIQPFIDLPPELKISFDIDAKDWKFSARDDISSPEDTRILNQNKTIKLTDQANNTTQANLSKTDISRIRQLKITKLLYNGKAAILAANSMTAVWQTGPDGKLAVFSQRANIGNESIIIYYNGKTTTVVETKNGRPAMKTIPGLRTISLTTDKGKLGWEY